MVLHHSILVALNLLLVCFLDVAKVSASKWDEVTQFSSSPSPCLHALGTEELLKGINDGSC